jgi:hypothetical protein
MRMILNLGKLYPDLGKTDTLTLVNHWFLTGIRLYILYICGKSKNKIKNKKPVPVVPFTICGLRFYCSYINFTSISMYYYSY